MIFSKHLLEYIRMKIIHKHPTPMILKPINYNSEIEGSLSDFKIKNRSFNFKNINLIFYPNGCPPLSDLLEITEECIDSWN
jgi:hypothetical protein